MFAWHLVASLVLLASSAIAVNDVSPVGLSLKHELLDSTMVPQPLQLIARTEDGKLEVVRESIEFIINTWSSEPFEVVAVVGPFHSGKSFLVNQFLGLMDGFELGPTVKPTTEGVWAFNVPVTDGEGLNILFLDTEGLSAPGNTPDYDAVMFAVSTLLSSHLIYNSMRIIDEQNLEYLELLARRAQMFQLKAALSQKRNDQLASDTILEFPPLTWVVQDFFQQQINNETPDDWLHRLLREQEEARAARGENGTGLIHVFPESYCKTVFLPAGTKHDLQHLDEMEMDQLNEDYRNDVYVIREHIAAALRKQQTQRCQSDGSLIKPSARAAKHMKCQPGRTPRQFGMLLQLLVDAANGGLLDTVPSTWQLVLQRQIEAAVEHAVKLFEREAMQEHDVSPPLATEDFDRIMNKIYSQATSIYSKQLFGLKSRAAEDGFAILQTKLDEQQQLQRSHHSQRVDTHIRTTSDALFKGFQESVGQLTMMKTTSLQTMIEDRKETALSQMKELLDTYPAEAKRVKSSLETYIQGAAAAARESNTKKLRTLFQRQEKQALTAARESRNRQKKTMLPPAELDHAFESIATRAIDSFKKMAEEFDEEPEYQITLLSIQNELEALHKEWIHDNDAMVQAYIEKQLDTIQTEAFQYINSVSLPVPKEEERRILKQRKQLALQTFEEATKMYRAAPCFKRVHVALQSALDDVSSKLNRRNLQAMKERVEQPLRKAYQQLKAIVDEQFVVFGLAVTARSLAMEQIGSRLNSEFREAVIEDWLSSTEEYNAGKLIAYQNSVLTGLISGAAIASVLLYMSICRAPARQGQQRGSLSPTTTPRMTRLRAHR
eukprot:m.170277 g.170277  ORF g.170277 m.170277 type:complete len:833 (-) comp16684_c0_seq4:145-2643(-)